MAKKRILIFLLACILVAGSVFSYLKYFKGPKVINIAVETKAGLALIVKTDKEYALRRLKDFDRDTKIGWWTQEGKLVVLPEAKEKYLFDSEGMSHIKCISNLAIVDLSGSKEKLINEKKLPGFAYLYKGRNDTERAIILEYNNYKVFPDVVMQNLGAIVPEDDKKGSVNAIDLISGNVQKVLLDGKPLLISPQEFYDGVFEWTKIGELIYVNRKSIYRGVINNEGNIDLKLSYTPQATILTAFTYEPESDKYIIQVINNNKLELLSVNSKGKTQKLLVSQDAVPHGLGSIGGSVLRFKDSPFATTYIDGNCDNMPPGFWSVNLINGEHKYLGDYYTSPIRGSDDWYYSKKYTGLLEPTEVNVFQRIDNKKEKGFTLPGWVDDIMIVGKPGEEYAVLVNLIPGSNPEDSSQSEVYVYDLREKYIQFLYSGAREVR